MIHFYPTQFCEPIFFLGPYATRVNRSFW
ncbi:MAG: hypothetical protein ACD_8C00131G0005, partial [uncultured bacterium]